MPAEAATTQLTARRSHHVVHIPPHSLRHVRARRYRVAAGPRGRTRTEPGHRPQAAIAAPGARAAGPAVEKHLKTFDTLDFDVFSNQKWDRLHESHAKDIVVTWPDGHETKGIDKHGTGPTASWTTNGFSGTARSS